MRELEVTLINGRRYMIIDTGVPYDNGEGGIKILLLHRQRWVFLDYSPDMDTAFQCLRGLSRLPPLDE